jgi:hypothetical protein
MPFAGQTTVFVVPDPAMAPLSATAMGVVPTRRLVFGAVLKKAQQCWAFYST